ncbi:hypothetical protein ASPWEDRAFT_23482 [Aspergillus wentii DTO 134E9]|uniref:C2H2-type domain-containing protein n=1 Tax=Aspergillus wentii DTO 134E9 TaxID=1073089 RepID=A0A1L9S2K0_ASPWE|nr:uncharacterized protein ASPWEDRAFT_23482 [Aspergillus wentii DTO 134E9]KAI9924432.1 hypothetical protein MW887_007058 [Aspergillus wentii]OJJ41388.1 hypothetical protein ASPWEDRAFT_23482 [Aspergillus wentii DTO 134E9]
MSKRSRTVSRSPSPSQDHHCSPEESWSRSSSPASSTGRSKLLHLQDSVNASAEVMRCSLPPHKETISFTSYEDYEVHYRQAHVNRCSECGKNFPTDRFLNLHIEENHDPLIAALRERGEKTYGCFIENCERKCSTPQKRRMHLIDKHMFPRTYNFFIVNDGIDKQTSLLRPMNTGRRRISATTATSPKAGRLRNRQLSQSSVQAVPYSASDQKDNTGSSEMEISELEKSMSALRFVPASVTKSQGRVRNIS